jgi:hypothetical protein
MMLLGLNHHEKHLKSTKHCISSTSFEWFSRGHYDVFINIDGSFHPDNGHENIRRALEI